jgi:hypothetical protein
VHVKRSHTVASIALGLMMPLLILSAATTPAAAQGGQRTAGGTSSMQAMLQANAPSPAHGLLAARAGRYTTVLRFRMGADGPVQESTGTATLTSICSGRFLLEEDAGTLMGEPFTGERLYGYNNGTKQYEASWAHTGSTAILGLTGTSEDGGVTIEWSGSYIDPAEGKQALRATWRQLDDDHFVIEVSGADPQAPHFSVLATTYSRLK